MIIQKNLPFARMARFYHDNVCHMPHDLTSLGPAGDQEAFGAALADYQSMLKALYADVPTFDQGNDEASYALLVNTVRMLFGCCTVARYSKRMAVPRFW